MLKEKLQSDMKAALKSGDSATRSLLGMVMSAIKNKELEKRGKLVASVPDPAELERQSALTDEEAMAVIASEVKRRKDSIAEFQKGGRPELAAGERKEMEMLMAYLPVQMSDGDLRTIVKKAIASIRSTSSGQAVGAKDMGKVIAAVMAEAKGSVDGQRVSAMVKEELVK